MRWHIGMIDRAQSSPISNTAHLLLERLERPAESNGQRPIIRYEDENMMIWLPQRHAFDHQADESLSKSSGSQPFVASHIDSYTDAVAALRVDVWREAPSVTLLL